MTSIRDFRDDRSADVEFRFYRKDADQVWVVGDFTGWQSAPRAMRPLGDGWWVLSTPMPAGEYRFRYLARERNAERWYTDFAANGVECAKGHWNGIVVVPEVPEAGEQPQVMRLAA